MSTSNTGTSASKGLGKYFGRLLLEPLPDGRLMRLAEVFGFLDPKGKRWPVPKHAQVDGASIPKALWSVMGGPFEGKYRDASVIHDYYCSVRIEPWQDVHRVFYDAMLASAVSISRAKLMYAAVYFSGPRWTDMDTNNTKVPRIDEQGREFKIDHSRFNREVFEIVGFADQSAADLLVTSELNQVERDEAQLNINKLDYLIQEYDPTPREIQQAIDQAVSILETQATIDVKIHTLVGTLTEL